MKCNTGKILIIDLTALFSLENQKDLLCSQLRVRM